MFDGFWASFAPAFTISFVVIFGIMLAIRTVQWTLYLIQRRVENAVEETIEAEKKSVLTEGLEALPWVASIAVVLATIYLRTRDARVTELITRAETAEAEAAKLRKVKPETVEVVDTGDDETDDEVRDRFPEDEVYSRS